MMQSPPGGVSLTPPTGTAQAQPGLESFNALAKLSIGERGQAGALAKTIDPRDSLSISNYGLGIQQRLSATSDPMLARVRARDTGETGAILTRLLTKTQAIDPTILSKGGGMLANVPVLGKLTNRVLNFIREFEKTEAQIDRIAHQLKASIRTLSTDVQTFDALFEDNRVRIQELLVYIAGGEIRLAQLNRDHQTLVQTASASQDPGDAQAALDLHNQILRLERRIYDLKVLVVVGLQMGPQIRLIQSSDQGLVEKLNTTLYTTIPLWRQQMALAIGLARQKEGVGLQSAVTQATNDMLQSTADALRTGTVAVANAVERGVVDIATLTATHEQLIGTIKDVLDIQENGRQARIDGERQLNVLTRDLSNELVAAQQGKLRLTGN